MELARFTAFVVKLAIVLALVGQLKTCTLQLLGLAAARSETGMMSYSAYTRKLFRAPPAK
jgi:hypothetical protein